ncbi:hypothetical protein RHGRI_036551 [Rhododendron griersonianum]|uniref:OTU domain-containing protein n=1 Tax=Rhododendron griersonianum TaxID=479676 RepID=A0AAV6HP78_9ERIC|nr:hypothetical protein RHGRI_036551 [Rhododendron griersonianum]
MITYEQDPDVVRWGLQLFEGDPYSNCGYYGSLTENNTDYYHAQDFKEVQYDVGCNNVEDDEFIALALQEQLSQLSVSEASGSPTDGEEKVQAPFYLHDWLGQPIQNYSYGNHNGHAEADDTRPSSSCSSPGEKSNCGEEWSYSLEIADEYALDGEVGKRLNQMIPIPHVPRINGDIPSVDEATLDHQRLLDRLQLYELIEMNIQGDGNCQFRALSDQFYRTPEHHKFVRQEVVNQLKSCPEVYEGYVPMAYGDYLKKMSKNGEWGDHVTLQAAADSKGLKLGRLDVFIGMFTGFGILHSALSGKRNFLWLLISEGTWKYGVKILVITSFKDTCYIEILPSVQRSERVICLSFWAEVHYNSIYPEGDVPELETKKKKRWWDFRDTLSELEDDYN